MTLLAFFLLAWSLLFGAGASDLIAKREFLDPEGDQTDRALRIIFATCSIAAAFGAGLLL